MPVPKVSTSIDSNLMYVSVLPLRADDAVWHRKKSSGISPREQVSWTRLHLFLHLENNYYQKLYIFWNILPCTTELSTVLQTSRVVYCTFHVINLDFWANNWLQCVIDIVFQTLCLEETNKLLKEKRNRQSMSYGKEFLNQDIFHNQSYLNW